MSGIKDKLREELKRIEREISDERNRIAEIEDEIDDLENEKKEVERQMEGILDSPCHEFSLEEFHPGVPDLSSLSFSQLRNMISSHPEEFKRIRMELMAIEHNRSILTGDLSGYLPLKNMLRFEWES